MKLRLGFVANSSSSDYMYANDDYLEENLSAEFPDEEEDDVIVYLKKQLEFRFED